MEETYNVDDFNFSDSSTETKENVETTPTQPTETSANTVEEPLPTVDKEQPETQESKETQVTQEPEVKISNPPEKYPGESELSYNLRQQIYNAGQAKAQATTEEEKSALRDHIKGLRKELAISTSQKAYDQQAKIDPIETTELPNDPIDKDEETIAKEALKKLGYLSQEEVNALIEAKLASQSKQSEQLQAADEFYSHRKDIASDAQAKKLLEDTVVARFNLTPQSTKQDMLFALEATANLLFPKSDSRSQRAAESAQKRDLVNFSSNTNSAPIVSKYDEQTAKALKEIGFEMKDMGW